MTSPVIIHCVRHAQGFHNLGEEYFNLEDPALTPLGEDQCATLRQTLFQGQSKIKLVVSSPMTRALHTAYLVFHPTVQTQKIIAIPEAQEIFDYGCDTGSEVDVLKTKTAENGWPVDLALVHQGWFDKNLYGPNSPVSSACAARARTVRRFLREKARALSQEMEEEIHVALVAHGSFLHYLSNDWENSTRGCGTSWSNCETRSYVFQDSDGDSDSEAWLVETAESRKRRGLEGPAPSMAQQQELYQQSMDGWVGQGLPDLRSVATASTLTTQEASRPKL
ncbi:hypothetical protein FALBO_15775 [Fusarium albosuccineum]|uniref:Phosphatase n=1 Tax=Fusarium albosuccineum TaxID=1237068 RepID=A0A8H4NXG7_9HYPO|nr:hypothetical protein FALBO_15775 [Fusarium albosuccineum]